MSCILDVRMRVSLIKTFIEVLFECGNWLVGFFVEGGKREREKRSYGKSKIKKERRKRKKGNLIKFSCWFSSGNDCDEDLSTRHIITSS